MGATLVCDKAHYVFISISTLMSRVLMLRLMEVLGPIHRRVHYNPQALCNDAYVKFWFQLHL